MTTYDSNSTKSGSSGSSKEAHSHSHNLTQSSPIAWRQLLPTHRLPVIAKTPLMVAIGVYISGGRFDNPAVGVTMLVTGLLWAVLYAINEATDLVLEQQLPLQRAMIATLLALGTALCIVAAVISLMLGALCAAMAVGQLAYCAPPVRLKRYWWAILLLSGMLNPVLRLECGALWGTHTIPPLAYAAFMSLHVGASIRSRILQRERDRHLSYRTAPLSMKWAGIACTILGLLGCYGLCVQGVLPRVFVWFTTVALPFSLYAWSPRVSNVSHLRRGWIWFAILAPIAGAILYLSSR